MSWDLNCTCQAQCRGKIISRVCPGPMTVSEMSSQASLHPARPTINPRATRWTHNKPKLRDRELAEHMLPLRGKPRQSRGTVSESRPRREQRNSQCPTGHCQRWKISQNIVTRPYLSQKSCQLPGRADPPGRVSQDFGDQLSKLLC